MSRRGVDPRLRELARRLGLDTRGDVPRRLRGHALGQVREWSEALPVESVSALQKLVAGMLSLSITFLRDDGDVVGAARRAGGIWPGLEAQLSSDFLRSDTLGLVMAHPAPEPGAHRYHAFIDARGDRRRMAYFTAWHEIAHLLLHPRQLELPGFRRVTAPSEQPRDPVELLVDDVAGALAFWEPFAAPALEREIRERGRLTLEGVRRVRDAVAPEGSIVAAARALLRLSAAPMAFCVARGEREERENSGVAEQKEFDLGPPPATRIVSAYANERAARRGFRIVPGMPVPARSAIASASAGPDGTMAAADEDQAAWADGATILPGLGLHVDAGRFGPVAYALVTCVPAGRRGRLAPPRRSTPRSLTRASR